MPLPKAKDRITLDEVGAPEFFVEWRLLGGIPYREVREIFDGISQEDGEDLEAVQNMFARLIINWNIPEEDGGNPLPLPSHDDDSVGKLPAMFVNYIASKMSETSGLTTGEAQDLGSETDSS